MTARRLALPYAIAGWLAAVAGAGAAIALRIVDPAPQLPSTFGFGDAALVGFAVLGIAFASVGAVLVVRRPGNVIGWLMVVIGDGYAVGIFWAAVTFSLAAHPSAISWLDVRVAGWLTVLFTSLGGAVFVLGFLFPTGRGQTPAWDRAIKVAAALTPFMFISVFLIRPGPLHVFPTIDNPFGFGFDLRPWLGDEVSARVSAMAAVLLPFVIWSITSRYRSAGRVERQQLKWFALAIGVAIACLAVAGLSASLFERPPEIGLALFGFAGALVPVAIGIAILRYRLYDIDRIISRTITYGALTLVLAAVFTVVVLVVGGVLPTVTSGLLLSSEGETIAVALSTLVVFALFQPVRARIQRAMDRRFDRARIDAERTAQAAVTKDLSSTVYEVVRPESLGLWLRGSGHRAGAD